MSENFVFFLFILASPDCSYGVRPRSVIMILIVMSQSDTRIQVYEFIKGNQVDNLCMHGGAGKREFTLSKAIGRDSFSMGAETEVDDVDGAFDSAETVEDAELMDVKDAVGRSEYNTS